MIKRLKKIINDNKNKINIFLIVFIVLAILLSNFISVHYSQDTYCFFDSGYRIYAKHFMYSGRPISAFSMAFSAVIHLPYEAYVIMMAIFATLFISLSISILYFTLLELFNVKKELSKKIVLMLLSFVTILNFCTTETLVFAESGIFGLGILFATISSCLWIIKNNKFKYIGIFVFGFLCVLCHQAVYNLYVTLSLLLVSIKYRNSIKQALKCAFEILVTYGINIVLATLFMKIVNGILHIDTRVTDLSNIKYIFATYQKYLKDILIYTFGIGEKYWYIVFIIITTSIFLICLFKFKRKLINLFYYVSIIMSSILLPILPLAILSPEEQYIVPRMAICFGASIGIAYIYIYSILDFKQMSNFSKRLGKLIVMILFISQCMYIIRGSSEMVAANKLDKNHVDIIVSRMREYEKKSGIIIKNVGIDFDMNPQFYYHNQEEYNCLNLKSLATEWAVIPMINNNSSKKLVKVDIPSYIHEKYYADKDWTSFDDAQIVFVDDTMYICIY